MENIITGIAISIILPIVYGFFYHLKEKEEKKINYGSEFTVKMSKGITIFFFIWMIICFMGMVGAVVLVLTTEEPNENQMFWIIETISLIFFLLGTLGFSISKFNYLVVKHEGIYIKKMFQKDRLIKYSDITYINSNSFVFGQVACYDSDGVPLFEVDHYHLGAEQLYSKLRNKGYLLLPLPYPTEDMKNNKKFQHHKKLSSTKVGLWCFLLFGIGSLLLGILVNSQINFKSYENYEVSGIVENFNKGEKVLKIYLKDDKKTYYINNIVYDVFDENVYSVLSENTQIRMCIAYIDKYERYNISELEINGKIYLNKNASENAEYSNYHSGLIGSYAFIGIGTVLEVFAVIYFIKIIKIKNEII